MAYIRCPYCDLAPRQRTDRIMRTGEPRRIAEAKAPASAPAPAADVAVEERPVEVPETPAPPKQAAYRARNLAAGRCARCGKPRAKYKYHCDDCQERKSAYFGALARAKRGHQPWRPGGRGYAPAKLKPILEMARVFTDAISDTDEARQRPALARAGIVMFVGFLFRRQQDWIVGFTKYDPKEVAACCRRLVQQGVWIEDDKLACLWMEAATATKRIPKRRQFELGLAFWMDGMVAAGDMTRETRDGEFHYGLPEWR